MANLHKNIQTTPDKINLSLILILSIILTALFFTLPSTVQAQTSSLTASIIIDKPTGYSSASANYFPDIGVTLTKGYAPFAVFFQGWNSSPRDTIVNYAWDFGPGSENDNGGRRFNGFNAGHIFETPGTYTVTLTITDYNGNQASATQQVQILAPTTTYYVNSQIGNDSYDGKSQTVVNSQTGPWKTAQKAFSTLIKKSGGDTPDLWPVPPGSKILFNRGQTFPVSTQIQGGYGWQTQAITFGAYGSGAKPLIQWTGPSGVGPMIVGLIGAAYIGFEDLQFNFLSPNGGQTEGLFHGNCGTVNLLVLRSDFFEPENGVLGTEGENCAGFFSTNVEIPAVNYFFVGNTVQNPQTALTAITQSYYFGIHGLAILNNSFDQSGNHEAYTSFVDKGVIAGNAFQRPAFGRTAFRIIGGLDENHQANNINISDNLILGWIDPIDCNDCGICSCPHGTPTHNGGGNRYNYHLVDFAPGGNGPTLFLNNILFERNVVTNFEQGMSIANAQDFTIRNNLFITPTPPDSSFYMVQLGMNGSDNGVTRPLNNIKIIGNTFVSNGPQTGTNGPMISILPWTNGTTKWGSQHQNLTIQNNIYYAAGPINENALYLAPSLLPAVHSDYNNYYIPGAGAWSAYPGQDSHSIAVNPAFSGTVNLTTYQPGQPSYQENLDTAHEYEITLHLSSSSPIIDKGFFYNVDSHFDFDKTLRDAKPDIGAFEYPGGSTGCTQNCGPVNRTNGLPQGSLAFGTTSTNVSLQTDRNATCRYSPTPGVAYASMTNAFSTTGETNHSMPVQGLKNGSAYNYYVRCSDTTGVINTDDYRISFSVASDATPPSVPTGLSANVISSTEIDLTWSASTDNVGVTGYNVYQNGQLIGTSATTSFKNTGLLPSTTYSYTVAAYDAAGNISAQSSSVSAKTRSTRDTTPPSVPTNLKAQVISSSEIDLTWDASTDNVGVAGYKIYKNGSRVGTSTTPSFKNTGLKANRTYTYTVAAYDAAGNTSAKSGSVSAKTKH